MPVTDRSQAKEGGWAQVREALTKFKGRVISPDDPAEWFGQWGGKLIDQETGKPIAPREFLQINCDQVEPLEVTEELSMDVTEFNFRVNCSDYVGSFWIDKFLESADQLKIQIPEGLGNKVVTFQKVTLESVDKKGNRQPKYDSTSYVIAGIEGGTVPPKPAPKVAPKAQPATKAQPIPAVKEQASEGEADPMVTAMGLAVGKTEAQFKAAIGIDPRFASSPLLSAAKAGIVTQALVNEGKLMVGEDGKYQKVV